MIDIFNKNFSEMLKKTRKSSFVYFKEDIIENCKRYTDSIKKHKINARCFFAVKANFNKEIMKIIKSCDFGFDVTSLGEIKSAFSVGSTGNNIVFSGLGKSKKELEFAIKNKFYQINCESLNEIRLIDEISKKLNIKTNIGIRINPNVDAKTYKKISTGKTGDKFGISVFDFGWVLPAIKSLKNVNLSGISFHIGSQITEISVFENLFLEVKKIYQDLITDGFLIKKIDLGGGIGVEYKPGQEIMEIDDYMVLVKKYIPSDVEIIFEPGRSIVANTGVILAKVLYVKESVGEKFVILDVGMNNLIRPAMYDAYHHILPVINRGGSENYNFVGPVCETSDFFASNRKATKIEEGDFVVIFSTGAYGRSMASNYNGREILKEVIL